MISYSRVLIIGAGPSGIACAIQLNRSGILPLVIERNKIGGLLYNANSVENYPGFPSGIPGEKLAELMKRQFESEKLKIIRSNVTNATFDMNKFFVKTPETVFCSDILVISSGSKPNQLDSMKYPDKIKKRILYEITEVKNFRNKKFLITGSGDLAFDYALSLGMKNNIILITRSEKTKCIPLLKEKIQSLTKFEHYNYTVIENIKKSNRNKMKVICRRNRETIEFETDYIIAAIGRKSNLDFLDFKLLKIAATLKKSGKLYITGDAAHEKFRQTSIAVGDGVKAAMMIRKNQEGKNWK